MARTFKLTDRDLGAKFRTAALKFKGKVSVGILSDNGEKATATGKTVLEVARINEFGEGVPERSFIRAWFDQKFDENREEFVKAFRAVADGRITGEQALELLGLKFVGSIQERIAEGIAPPNSPKTIARKGSDTPLIDTGQLRSSVSHKVETGNGSDR